MENEAKMKSAQIVYDGLCAYLDERKLKYAKHPERWTVHFIMGGEDIPMDIVIAVDPDRQLVRVLSMMPFKFSEKNRTLGAIATCQANYKLTDGSFDYNYNDGTIFFRLTTSYMDSLISKDVYEYMLYLSCIVIDKFNDKFLMLEKGELTLERFMLSD